MRVETLLCDKEIGRNRRPCGEPLEDVEPTTFVIDGIEYEALLCAEHKDGFVDAVGPYLNIATPTTKRSHGKVRKVLKGKRGTPFTTSDVREWARAQGYEVPQAGRLPGELLDAYAEVHP